MHLHANIAVVLVALLLMGRFWYSLDARMSAAGPAAGTARLRRAHAAAPLPVGIDRRLEPCAATDLRRLIEALPGECEALLRGTGIRLIAVAPPESLDLLARPAELRQLFAHLLAIAGHAMPRGGSLHLGMRRVQSQAVIELQDSGEGRAEPLLALLFLHGAAGRAGLSGADAGLAASVANCRRIVAAHQGRIDAAILDSGEEGLVIRLPLIARV